MEATKEQTNPKPTVAEQKQKRQSRKRPERRFDPMLEGLAFQKFTPPEWQSTHRADPSALAAMKQLISMSKDEIEDRIMENIEKSKFYKMDLEPLAKNYMVKNKALMNDMQSLNNVLLPPNVTAKDLGISYSEKLALKNKVFAAENDLIEQKFGFTPNRGNLAMLRSKLGLPNQPEMSNHDLRTLLLLDDPPEELQHLIDKAHKYRMFKSETAWADPFVGKADHTFGSTQNTANLIKSTGGIIKQPSFNPFYVDIATIKTVLYPDKHANVITSDQAYSPASVIKYSNSYPAQAGTGILGIFTPAGNTNIFQLANYTASTGAYTVVTSVSHPLTASTNLINFQLVGASIKYNSAVGASTQSVGTVYWWHDPSIKDGFANTFPTTGSSNTLLANIGNRTQSGNGTTNFDYRQVSIIDNITEDASPDSPTSIGTAANAFFPTVWYILNGSPTQSSGYFEISLVWNAGGTGAGLTYSVPMNPAPVGFTKNCIQAISTICPQIYQASPKWISGFLTAIESVSPDYETVLHTASAYCGSNPILTNNKAVFAEAHEQEISFSKLME